MGLLLFAAGTCICLVLILTNQEIVIHSIQSEEVLSSSHFLAIEIPQLTYISTLPMPLIGQF